MIISWYELEHPVAETTTKYNLRAWSLAAGALDRAGAGGKKTLRRAAAGKRSILRMGPINRRLLVQVRHQRASAGASEFIALSSWSTPVSLSLYYSSFLAAASPRSCGTPAARSATFRKTRRRRSESEVVKLRGGDGRAAFLKNSRGWVPVRGPSPLGVSSVSECVDMPPVLVS